MDEEYLLAAVRYVERNPVAAKLCEQAEDWKWSSARAHFDGRDDLLVRVQPMLDRVADWRQFLSGTVQHEKVELIGRHTRTGRPLGDSNFVRKLELITGKSLAPKPPGRKPLNDK